MKALLASPHLSTAIANPLAFYSSPSLLLLWPTTSLSSSSSSVASSLRFSPPKPWLLSRSRSIVAMALAPDQPVEVLVKAAVGQSDKIGDCPFSQRVLLTLEEKNVPYHVKHIDLTNKPDWFLEINPGGEVPVIKHEGKWVSDSGVIAQILEEKFPEPSLETPPEKATIGSKVFPSFVKFLKSKDPSDGTEETLVAELKSLNDYLKDNGLFINGDQISAADLSLAPKLLHVQVALGHYKKWSVPNDLTYLKNYIEALHSRKSFVKTKPAEEHLVAGWKKHVM